ncbi:glycoside hydrolase family 5 protein [Lepidopterella palustris CBS 459.81]|uniref:Glycoside hydrolase family 5 protein n=1 Tax=Lepidopterella palustris CBS 459.81 TaxID=1314670 RepID=A0A8E2DZ22_9PEZI|nr:glycoside hydrolase family 5 protein [Lepidopterella palustris CBS 459.81]
MKGFLHKARDHVQSSLRKDEQPTTTRPPPPIPGSKPVFLRRNAAQTDQPPTIAEPSSLDVLRYRYHHGTNLGSIYVLEKWLHPSMFPGNAASNQSSELEAVHLWVDQIGMDATRAKFETHWANAVSDDDLIWLSQSANCTSIRLPLGYFTLGPAFTQGTPFDQYSSIYTNAWPSVQHLTGRLRAHGIGVLLDLHALPGGANGADHSGTNGARADLWTSSSNQDLGVRCVQFLAQQVRDGLDGVIGIQLCNEADWEAPGMYLWYDRCITAISAIDASIPIYISDAWNMSKALDYAASKNTAFPLPPTCPVIVDTHLYWAFSDADKAKTPQTIISEVGTKLGVLDGKEGSVIDRGAVQVIVGEYSCVLTEDSWAKSGGDAKSDLVKRFGQAQSTRYQQRAGGSYFWTYKMDWLPGGEWGFSAQTTNGSITSPPPSRLAPSDISTRISTAAAQRDTLMQRTVAAHVNYWDATAPGTSFEHWRFENGWKVGFADASAFFGLRASGALSEEQTRQGADRIGCVEIWVLKRVRESGMRGGFVWEFEQGVRQGIRDFYLVVGV